MKHQWTAINRGILKSWKQVAWCAAEWSVISGMTMLPGGKTRKNDIMKFSLLSQPRGGGGGGWRGKQWGKQPVPLNVEPATAAASGQTAEHSCWLLVGRFQVTWDTLQMQSLDLKDLL
jgi:hypothetical protein